MGIFTITKMYFLANWGLGIGHKQVKSHTFKRQKSRIVGKNLPYTLRLKLTEAPTMPFPITQQFFNFEF